MKYVLMINGHFGVKIYNSKEDAQIVALAYMLEKIEYRIQQFTISYDVANLILEFIKLLNSKKYEEAINLSFILLLHEVSVLAVDQNQEQDIINAKSRIELLLSNHSMKIINNKIKEFIFK